MSIQHSCVSLTKYHCNLIRPGIRTCGILQVLEQEQLPPSNCIQTCRQIPCTATANDLRRILGQIRLLSRNNSLRSQIKTMQATVHEYEFEISDGSCSLIQHRLRRCLAKDPAYLRRVLLDHADRQSIVLMSPRASYDTHAINMTKVGHTCLLEHKVREDSCVRRAFYNPL